jgi:predicted transcriptional regulator
VRSFGQLEAHIMDRLWSWARPATVREVHDDLAREREIAYTTVMTVMDNLHRKGVLAREKNGRAYVYQPTRSHEAYTAELMHEALHEGADLTATFAHFCRQMSAAEVKALRAALDAAPRRRRRS